MVRLIAILLTLKSFKNCAKPTQGVGSFGIIYSKITKVIANDSACKAMITTIIHRKQVNQTLVLSQ